MYDRFSGFQKILIQWKKYWKYDDVTFIFNEESDYFEENTCENEAFRSIILHHGKKLNIITPQLPIYYIQY